jgi:hypothetical protein
MFRRAALMDVNYITNRPDYVEDFHLSSALAAAGYGNVYLNEILSYYRVWTDSGKVRQRRKLMEIKGLQKVFAEVIEPGYKERGWNILPISRKRTELACTQADCLGWNVYSEDEKQELARALNNLSSSTRARVFIWLYLNKYGRVLDIYRNSLNSFKFTFKNLIVSFKN